MREKVFSFRKKKNNIDDDDDDFGKRGWGR